MFLAWFKRRRQEATDRRFINKVFVSFVARYPFVTIREDWEKSDHYSLESGYRGHVLLAPAPSYYPGGGPGPVRHACDGCGEHARSVEVRIVVKAPSSGRVIAELLAIACSECGYINSTPQEGPSLPNWVSMREGKNLFELLELSAAKSARLESVQAVAKASTSKPDRRSALAATAR